MNPRKGLKRVGLRTYAVEGLGPTILIDRERARKFRIRRETYPPGFYFQEFRRLTDARAAAEHWVNFCEDK